jgi:hypothetical protein
MEIKQYSHEEKNTGEIRNYENKTQHTKIMSESQTKMIVHMGKCLY